MSTATDDTTPEDRANRARDDLRTTVHNAVRRNALTVDGPEHTREVPVFPGARSLERRARPLTELRMATWLAGAARIEVDRIARKARSAGIGWAEIAPFLDLEVNGDKDASRYDRAVAAFEHIAGPSISAFQFSSVSFTCDACGQAVHDKGPYENHPDDNESGHTPTCTTRQAALAEHKQRFGDDDE